MIDLGKYYESKGKGLSQIVVSDSNTIVFFRRTFNPETGEALPMEVVSTTTREELDAKKAELQAQIDLIDKFLAEEL